MKKYIVVFKNRMDISLQYRFDLVGHFLIEFLTVGSFLTLWYAAFRGHDQIREMNFDQLVVYYVFVPLVGVLTTVQLADTLGKHIKDGFLSVFLIKPQKVWFYYIIDDFGRKIYQSIVTCIFYAFVYFSLLGIFELDVKIGLKGVGFGLIFCLFGLILNYILDLVISTFAFWIDEVWSFKHFKRVLVWTFGGVGFPFELLSSDLNKVLNLLPFRYLYYLPLSYLSGRRVEDDFLLDGLKFLFWLLFFVVIYYFLWKRGLKKYGAFGN